jgi:hypothetical protein
MSRFAYWTAQQRKLSDRIRSLKRRNLSSRQVTALKECQQDYRSMHIALCELRGTSHNVIENSNNPADAYLVNKAKFTVLNDLLYNPKYSNIGYEERLKYQNMLIEVMDILRTLTTTSNSHVLLTSTLKELRTERKRLDEQIILAKKELKRKQEYYRCYQKFLETHSLDDLDIDSLPKEVTVNYVIHRAECCNSKTTKITCTKE